MSAPPFMKLYIADYHVETTDFDVVGHGAYLLLLMAMWRAGGKLPSDEGKLQRLAKCDDIQWAKIRIDVLSHFKRRGGSYTHLRIVREIGSYRAVVAGASEGGKATQSKNRNKNKKLDVAMPLNSLARKTQGKVNQPEPEPEPDKKGEVENRASPSFEEVRDRVREAGGQALASPATNPMILNAQPIYALLQPNGHGPPCDFELDVLPVVRARCANARAASIRSLAYFRDEIVAARDLRLAGAPAQKPIGEISDVVASFVRPSLADAVPNERRANTIDRRNAWADAIAKDDSARGRSVDSGGCPALARNVTPGVGRPLSRNDSPDRDDS